MDRHRGDHQRHHEHQHSNFNQHYPDQNQFNNHNHYNYDSNQQMSGEANEPFSGGLFRSNGRKRGRFHSSDYGDGGVHAKLYIAPIPRTTTEENIRSLFEEHGSIVEVVLPRDKRTGQQQVRRKQLGWYNFQYGKNLGLLVLAVQVLELSFHIICLASWDFDVCSWQLERSRNSVTKLDSLCFSSIVIGARWIVLLTSIAIIVSYGKFMSICHVASPYCFVKYATFEEADRAIRALHNQHTIPGEVVPFKVRYADGERERPALRCPVVEGVVDKLYVGSVNKLASKQEIEEIFSPYGHVEDVYIARDELKQSRGCAFVKFSHRDMALAAIKGLNGTVTMRGCDQPLIVRFADPKKPKTGELRFCIPFLFSLYRGSYAFGGPNLGPCSQQPMIRPAPGCCLPNVSFSMQQTSTTGVPQAVAYAAPHITEQPLSSVKHSPSQLSQMPLQHMQAPEKCFQSPQQAIFDTHKQTQILEQQQNQQIALQEVVLFESKSVDGVTSSGGYYYVSVPIWTGSTQLAGCNSATSAVPPSPQIMDPEECDWSEHSCPDGYKYYFNCITCESRWEKPVEFTLFQQQFQEQKRLHGSNQQPSLSRVCSAEEVDRTQKVLLEMHLLHQKLQQSSLSDNHQVSVHYVSYGYVHVFSIAEALRLSIVSTRIQKQLSINCFTIVNDLAASFIFHVWKVLEVLDLWPYSVEPWTSGSRSALAIPVIYGI
ncbi:hypothetical protein SADUNF_Sadunf02G0170400 [Salix dunnii]|uniref:Flowering time control protein FCA n=1 Tax=Salix dunnii TaxID=1413687 RepID=A0A835N8D1_9ROSI|nr:hypothetical protein SADUNF_Sadunf02G0170400 [Salix dunnii]